MSPRRGDKDPITISRANRRAWLAAVVFAGTLPVALSGAAIAANDPVKVIMKDHRFEPGTVEVRPGQAIRFDNDDDTLHSLLLVGQESVIGEEFVEAGQSYTVQIPQDLAPSTYELACTIHVDMRGQIVVSGD